MTTHDVLTATIKARKPWNDTGIPLQKGGVYQIDADGRWNDFYKRCGPAGYSSTNALLRIAERSRRVTDQPWFMLIGAIDKEHCFPIGCHLVLTAPRSGNLFCFANDVRMMYWNNFHSITLSVRLLE
jgi:hypothetical protein